MMTQHRVEFWMVWREGSNGSRVKHFTKQEALREADRLAKAYRGDTFFVLKTTAALRAPDADLPPPVRITLEKSDGIPF